MERIKSFIDFVREEIKQILTARPPKDSVEIFSKFIWGHFIQQVERVKSFINLVGESLSQLSFAVKSLCLKTFENSKLYFHHSRTTDIQLFPEYSKPTLSTLEWLIELHDNPKEQNTFYPTYLEESITSPENISSLTLHDMEHVPFDVAWKSYTSTIRMLDLIEILNKESSIQELEICNPITLHQAMILRRMTAKRRGLKLKRFTYNNNYNNNNCKRKYKYMYEQGTQERLIKFLIDISDTLEYLTIGKSGIRSFTTLPEFSRLIKLRMKFSKLFNTKHVNLNETFPVLQELEIWRSDCNRRIDEFLAESDPCRLIKSFHSSQFHFTINAFNQVLLVFPNLIELRVDIGEDCAEILGRIWSQMTQLESLSIYGTIKTKDSLDSVLTGIPVRALQELRDIVYKMDEIPGELERRELIVKLRNQHARLPSITNLTNLRSLSWGPICFDSVELTDLSGYLGHYPMRSLKHLSLHHSKLTKTCCEIMTKDMGLETWTFTTDYEDIIPYQH